jgi:hypothetical protein
MALGLRKSRHQGISWAVSGADDTSPCCEQFNLLRIGPNAAPCAKKLAGPAAVDSTDT